MLLPGPSADPEWGRYGCPSSELVTELAVSDESAATMGDMTIEGDVALARRRGAMAGEPLVTSCHLPCPSYGTSHALCMPFSCQLTCPSHADSAGPPPPPKGGNNCVSHAFSADGTTWTFTGVAATADTHYTDGTSTSFAYLERPHLIFDESGTKPVALTNGVKPGWGVMQDQSFTLLRPLKQ